MNKTYFHSKLNSKFAKGITYRNAVEVCVALFCSADWVKGVHEDEVSTENIAKVFSELAKGGIITNFEEKYAIEMGVDGNPSGAEHWIQIMKSSLKRNRFYDPDTVSRLLS